MKGTAGRTRIPVTAAPTLGTGTSSLLRRRIWAEGDYHALLERFGIGEIGAHLVERAGVGAGMRVLDVATGTGNVAVHAAAAGAAVFGVDITEEMLAGASRHARGSGRRVTLVQGDAEALPFADARFDRVLSGLGVMFAADHARAAAELVRVCRPGGTIGLCSWTPEGVPGVVARALDSHLCGDGSGCDAGSSPLQWGSEDRVRSLFAGRGVSLRFERASAPIVLDSSDAYLRILADHAGPVAVDRAMLVGWGRWARLSTELGILLEASNETPGAGWTARQEYLVVVATKDRPGAPAGTGGA